MTATKDNVGTLHIFADATPDPPQQPLNFSSMVDQTPRLSRTESIAPSGAACRTNLFQANTVPIVKGDHIRRQSGVAASCPFFIGSLETDVTEDDNESYFDFQLYVPSFQDCLNFIHHGKVNVHRDAVICTVDKTEIQTGHCFIKLSEETYKTLLSELHDVEDLLPEDEGFDVKPLRKIRIKKAIKMYWLKQDPSGHYLAEWCSGRIAWTSNFVGVCFSPARLKQRTETALIICIIHPGGNFRFEYSVLELVQTQNGNITKCTSINEKVHKEKKKCTD